MAVINMYALIGSAAVHMEDCNTLIRVKEFAMDSITVAVDDSTMHNENHLIGNILEQS